MKLGGIIGKLAKIKGIGYIATALLAGIVLLLTAGDKDGAASPSADPVAEYVAQQEARLCDMGRRLCGVECTVVVHISGGYTYSYAGDQSLRTVYNADGSVAEKEISLSHRTVNTKEGTALVALKQSTPLIKGVAVVCTGASTVDAESLKQLIMALYSLKEDAVFVTN